MTNDPCLTCPLPVCDDKDPRCAWRQSPGYLRKSEYNIAYKKRQRERARSQQKAAAFLEENRAALEKQARQNRCRLLWESGHDTQEIADRLGVPESMVYNELLPRVRA